MYRDSRGGHNRKSVNENFLKTWSPQMAYVLGLIFADGAVEDTRKSSRTCYVHLTSKDESLLNGVRAVLSSNHPLYLRKPHIVAIRGKQYLSSKIFNLRISNKVMYQDLVHLGVTPRKSLTMKFPDMPKRLFSFFLRGYFDGDGNLSVYILAGRRASRVRVTFTSGSYKFLKSLSEKLTTNLKVGQKNLYKNINTFHLRYSKREGLKILSFMYQGLKKAPYLDRKYLIYRSLFED